MPLLVLRIQNLMHQDPRQSPSSASRHTGEQYDISLYSLNISASGWKDLSTPISAPPSTSAQRCSAKKVSEVKRLPQPSCFSVNPLASFVLYMCVLCSPCHLVQRVQRCWSHIFGKVEHVDTDFLVDKGASVTIISKTLFPRIPNHWRLPQVEVPSGFRLSAASVSYTHLTLPTTPYV